MGLFDFLKKKRTDEVVSQTIKIEETAKQSTQFDESSHLQTVETKKSFYMKVADVFTITGKGTVVTGDIQDGSIQSGDLAYIIKANGETIKTVIIGIEKFRKIEDKAEKGESVGLLLKRISRDEVNKGDFISATKKMPNQVQNMLQQNDEDSSVCRAAVEKLTDRNLVSNLPASAVLSPCINEWEEKTKVTQAIKNTWYVDCEVYSISKEDSDMLEASYPCDTNARMIQGTNIPYIIELSSNAIFTHEYGAFLNFGYVKFLYKDKLYYVNVAPMVQLTNDLYNRSDILCHMAKILICLLPKLGGANREKYLVRLDGELRQD